MVTSILLVGCGKMGGALLHGWIKNDALVISTFDPHYADADYHSAADITATYDVIVLAVKPQIMADVARDLKHLVKPATLILSIAAGKTIGFYEDIFGAATSIVRVMPNTPALIGKGMSVLCGNAATSAPQRHLSMNLMAVAGDAEWIDTEYLMDAVTAVSGSGPAYVFHLVEAMTAAGIAAGLPPALSEKLSRQTVIGSAALAESDGATPAATFRQNVTSPGGTTEAALKILMSENGLTDLMTRAIQAAQKRGKELAS
ncbi:MAG TPA: pyrroline-5-carboxylate reductase [Rhodospirillaceae bacterium]|nr:pyrroline-5-carboxylate reductase [Rhodospirillaceae bacterium]